MSLEQVLQRIGDIERVLDGTRLALIVDSDLNEAKTRFAALQEIYNNANSLLDELITGPALLKVDTTLYPQPYIIKKGEPTDFRFTITGGTPPYKVIWSGDMPAGLDLSSTGHLTGVCVAFPRDAVLYPLVTDAAGHYYAWSFWMRIIE